MQASPHNLSRRRTRFDSITPAARAIVLGAGLMVAGGCTLLPRDASKATATAPAATADGADAATKPLTPAEEIRRRQLIVLEVNLDIVRARVPKGFFGASEKIWNHIDTEVLPAQVSTLLQKNGIRAGRGKLASWAPIKALLETEKRVETSQSSVTVNNGLPLSVQIDPRQRDQTVFIYRQDGSMPGATFPLSSNYLHIEYGIPADAPDSVLVEVMPEIRQRPAQTDLTINDLGQLDRPIVEPGRIFRELGVRMQIGPDEFCAIGPSRSAHRACLLGTILLCDDTDGRPYESMYFLTPRVVRKDQSVKAP